MFKYEIDGKVYVQKELVWGQVKQIIDVLKGVTFPPNPTPLDIISILYERLPSALAIVLTEEGQSVKDKDLTALSSELSFKISLGVTMQVIEDFFDCNPTALLLERLQKLIGKISNEVTQGILSTGSSSSSAEETSANTMQ